MSEVLWLDLETRSRNSIKLGHHNYAEESEILLIAWALGDDKPQVYDLTTSCSTPDELEHAIKHCTIRTMGSFDRVIMQHHKYDFSIDRHECVMALARSNSLPGGLDKLCKIFGVPEDLAKQAVGKDYINLFCVPNKKTGAYGQPADHPEEWELFKFYAKSDILAMREVYKRLSRHNYDMERKAWVIYENMNSHGFKVDLELANSAIDMVAVELGRSKIATSALIDPFGESGGFSSVTQTQALLNYIKDRTGKFVPNLQCRTVTELLSEGGLPEDVLELLALRQVISKSSTSKYKRVVSCVGLDGRLRDTMVFNGALRTRRNTGAIFNPLNLPRPSIKGGELEEGIHLLKYKLGYLKYDSIMPLCSSALRGVIVAESGGKLVVSDWSNIEGRLAAWYAGETWLVQAFKDFDSGAGADLYRVAYSKMMSVPIDAVDDGKPDGAQRQIGKTLVLACQYGGSVPAFLVFSGKINIPEMCKKLPITDRLAWDKACKMWNNAEAKDKCMGLDRDTYTKIAYLVVSWRLAHPNIVKKWYSLDDACRNAINGGWVAEGSPYVEGRFLIIPLPSGQRLMYLDPFIDSSGICFTDGRYGDVRTYGSKIFENIVQSMNKDILCGVLPNVVSRGYQPLLTIYDEIVTQTPDLPEYNEAELSKLMTANLPWCEGLPLAAKGFESYRYRKG